ncbi:Small ribosomal subunit protein uS19m [Cladobotryum mycophilum]|uniref:Small ribosomal subunit protein uS19m n=1 Tax=Cladobotryum mycophilum TaxID=491253 RepID=A0ABR0SIP4_9HYPO
MTVSAPTMQVFLPPAPSVGPLNGYSSTLTAPQTSKSHDAHQFAAKISQSVATIAKERCHRTSRLSTQFFHNAALKSLIKAFRPNLVPLPIVWPKKVGDKVPPVRTQARSATILPNFVGLRFEIHNGKEYHQIVVTEDMVGHKLGEFSPTRKPHIWDKK